MEYIHQINISTDKKYLVLSSSKPFLKKVRNLIENTIDVSDIEDVVTHRAPGKSSEDIIMIFKEKGFIRFLLYGDNLYGCNYDTIYVDSQLYVNEYSNIRRRCVLSDIICISGDNIIDELCKVNINGDEKDRAHVYDISYDNVGLIEYGMCGKCKSKVYSNESACPVCNSALKWKLSKDFILKSCQENINANNTYNIYYNMYKTFGITDLEKMSEKELNNLIKISKNILLNIEK